MTSELCGDECPQLFGEQAVSCTLPKGHAAHRNSKRGTGWEKLCDDGYRRVEQAEAQRDALRKAIEEIRDGWYQKPFMSDQADELDAMLDEVFDQDKSTGLLP